MGEDGGCTSSEQGGGGDGSGVMVVRRERKGCEDGEMNMKGSGVGVSGWSGHRKGRERKWEIKRGKSRELHARLGGFFQFYFSFFSFLWAKQDNGLKVWVGFE